MSDTIAAIATASGNGSISILRVSGPESVAIVDGIFFKKNGTNGILSKAPSHTIHYGWIGKTADEQIDEVLVLLMRAPRSYTAEDVVEIHCHGGGMAAKSILEFLLESGVRLAEPGEFTKRAFLNGRIDLTQAESVMEVIRAKSDLALSTAEDHLRGDVRDRVRAMREVVLSDMAYLEAALDDPEHIELTDYPQTLLNHLAPIDEELTCMLHLAENGRRISEGIRTAIIGRPNVGKSSFLNCILREDRAIVTDVPGTTRDTLEEDVWLGGILLRLIDTAGIRETSDVVEHIGVEKAKSAYETADFLICVLDASEELTPEDRGVLDMCKDKSSVVLLNKSDLTPVVTEDEILDLLLEGSGPQGTNKVSVLSFSAETGEGLRELELLLEELFLKEFFDGSDSAGLSSAGPGFDGSGLAGSSHEGSGSEGSGLNGSSATGRVVRSLRREPVITSLRQKEALREVKDGIKRIRQTIDAGMPEDLLTVDLLSVYESLGRVTGETMEDDLVDKIFSDFCMGK